MMINSACQPSYCCVQGPRSAPPPVVETPSYGFGGFSFSLKAANFNLNESWLGVVNNVTNNITINPRGPEPVEFGGQIGFTPDGGQTVVLPGIGMTGTRTVANPHYGKPLPTDLNGRPVIDQYGNGRKVTMAEVMAT